MSRTQAFQVRKAASTKGESTAFWSREKIAEMLAEEGEDLESIRAVRKPFTPGQSARLDPKPPGLDQHVPVPDGTISGA